jgi:hypothetical protein
MRERDAIHIQNKRLLKNGKANVAQEARHIEKWIGQRKIALTSPGQHHTKQEYVMKATHIKGSQFAFDCGATRPVYSFSLHNNHVSLQSGLEKTY